MQRYVYLVRIRKLCELHTYIECIILSVTKYLLTEWYGRFV